MAERKDTAGHGRDAFLGTVAHDLRAPLAGIAGFADALLDGSVPPEKEKAVLSLISDEAHRLSRLVSSLLDVTRLDAGARALAFTRFDVCELLRRALLSLEAPIDKKRLQVCFSDKVERCFIRADRDAVHEAAYNLLQNAVKYSPEGGTLRVEVLPDGEKCRVAVTNDGEVAPDELPRLFDRYYRTSGAGKADETGVGLGLYIVKRLIEAHGETVSAESSDGVCTFSFTMPLDGETP